MEKTGDNRLEDSRKTREDLEEEIQVTKKREMEAEEPENHDQEAEKRQKTDDYEEGSWQRVDHKQCFFLIGDSSGPDWSKVIRRETYDLKGKLIDSEEVSEDRRNDMDHWRRRIPGKGMQNIRTVLYYKKDKGQGGELKRKTDVTLGSQASKWRKAYEESGKHKRKIDDDVYGDNDDDVQEDKKKRVNMGVMMPEGQQKC